MLSKLLIFVYSVIIPDTSFVSIINIKPAFFIDLMKIFLIEKIKVFKENYYGLFIFLLPRNMFVVA